MPVTLTTRAAEEVKKFLDQQGYDGDMVLRVRITGGGCGGFSYAFGFDKQWDQKTDTKHDCLGIPVVVDRKSALLLDGTTVDFHEGFDRRGFTFNNPNAVGMCHCRSACRA